MPTQLDFDMEKKFIANGGTVCPYDDLPVEDHPKTDGERGSNTNKTCALLAHEVARWVQVRRPEQAPQ